MALYPATLFNYHFFNRITGAFLAGGTIEAYLAGTSTPTTMYSSAAGASLGDTVTLSSAGVPTSDGNDGNEVIIFLDSEINYKFILKDVDGVTVETQDNLNSVLTTEKYASMAAFIAATPGSNLVYIQSYSAFTPGSSTPKGGHYRYKTGGTNTSPTVGSPVAVSTIGTGTQAGYAWDASGAEWFILISGDYVDGKALGVPVDGATDASSAISSAFQLGKKLEFARSDQILLGSAITNNTDNAGLKGGYFLVDPNVSATADLITNNADNFTVEDAVFDGQDDGCQTLIRNTPGAVNFRISRCEFKDFYTETYLWLIRIRCDDAYNFLLEDLKFRNINCLGNTVIADNDGSVRAIRTDYSSGTVETGGTIRNIEIVNLNTVNAGGSSILEDADAIQLGGGVGIHVHDIWAYNVGKRVVKVQAKRCTVENIFCNAQQTLAHSAIVDVLEEKCTVNNVIGIGNIASFVAQGQQNIRGTSINNVIGETTYTGDPTAVTAMIDIKGGEDITINNVNVRGGPVGFRGSIEGSGVALKKVKVSNSTFDATGFAGYIRNTLHSVVVDDISFSNVTFIADYDSGPAFDINVTSPRVVKNIKLENVTSVLTGSYTENVRISDITGLTINGLYLTTAAGVNSLRVARVDGYNISNVYEETASHTQPVVKVFQSDDGNISNINGSFVTASNVVGLVNVEGCDNVRVSGLVNSSTGTDVAFLAASGTDCTNVYLDCLDASFGVDATYDYQNVTDVQARRYGTTAQRPALAQVGHHYYDTTTVGTVVWNGSSWV